MKELMQDDERDKRRVTQADDRRWAEVERISEELMRKQEAAKTASEQMGNQSQSSTPQA